MQVSRHNLLLFYALIDPWIQRQRGGLFIWSAKHSHIYRFFCSPEQSNFIIFVWVTSSLSTPRDKGSCVELTLGAKSEKYFLTFTFSINGSTRLSTTLDASSFRRSLKYATCSDVTTISIANKTAIVSLVLSCSIVLILKRISEGTGKSFCQNRCALTQDRDFRRASFRANNKYAFTWNTLNLALSRSAQCRWRTVKSRCN